MDVKQLEYFLGVCKHRSFSKAAASSFISPQGLNMAIIRLERELGCKLFDRTKDGVNCTQEGEYLLEKARIVVDTMEECEHHYKRNLGNREQVNVACITEVLAALPPDACSLLQKKTPWFYVSIRETGGIICDELVEKGECAFGIVNEPVDREKFEADFIIRHQRLFIVNKKHPLAKYDSISVDQLKGESLVFVDNSYKTYHTLEKACNERGFSANVVIVSKSMAQNHNLVRNDPELVAFSFDFFCDRIKDPSIKALPFNDIDFFWDICLINKIGAQLSKAEEAFKSRFLECFKKDGT